MTDAVITLIHGLAFGVFAKAYVAGAAHGAVNTVAFHVVPWWLLYGTVMLAVPYASKSFRTV